MPQAHHSAVFVQGNRSRERFGPLSDGAHRTMKSLEVITNVFVEPSLKQAKVEEAVQFIRKGYFCLDKDSTLDHLVFNRTVSLKDTWAKLIK